MADPAEQEQPTAQPAAATAELTEFESLLNKEFKPKTVEAKSAVKLAVQTLAEQALSASTLISDNVIKTIEAIIAEIDRKLSEQMNLILHHEDFKALEGSWRGLHYLVNNTETGENLKIRVMNISKKDVAKTLKKFKGTAWDQSPLFKKLYEEEFGMPGSQPGCLVGDYYFDHSARCGNAGGHRRFPPRPTPPPSRRGAFAAQHGNLAGTRQSARPAKIFGTPAHAAWKSLRQSEDSRYLGLTMPRVLARMPYWAKTSPVDGSFEEDTAGADQQNTSGPTRRARWRPISRVHSSSMAGARIRGAESGGMVEGLPVHTFPLMTAGWT
jgi:type VI secretion system protein ImpC